MRLTHEKKLVLLRSISGYVTSERQVTAEYERKDEGFIRAFVAMARTTHIREEPDISVVARSRSFFCVSRLFSQDLHRLDTMVHNRISDTRRVHFLVLDYPDDRHLFSIAVRSLCGS